MKFRRFVIRDDETGDVLYLGVQFAKQSIIVPLNESFTISAEHSEIVWRFGSEDSGCYVQYIDEKDFSFADVDGLLGSLG